MNKRPQRILLIGGGHCHIEVLRRFAARPDRSVALTLVSPDAALVYSGMLPGQVAGYYGARDAQIPLAPLAAAASVRLLTAAVVALDLRAREAVLDSGMREAFDLASIDIGSTPDLSAPGARGNTLPVKPWPQFLLAWQQMQAGIVAGNVRSIAVVGGGAGGVEILLAMQHRLRVSLGSRAPRFTLLTDRNAILPEFPAVARARFERILVERKVVLETGNAAIAVEPGAIIAADGERFVADRVVWATSAAAQPWLAASGLACDARGFIRTDAALRSVSHPFVFAAGDCAFQAGSTHPKSGVYAVRQGPPLASNLRRAAHEAKPLDYHPQRHALALVSTGDRHAVAIRGPFVAEGDWVWRWKNRIDRRFVAKYTLPFPASPASAANFPE